MFSIFFRWPKASKCKKMIKRAQCRLRHLKSKREVMAMQIGKDLSELIQNGHQETAIMRYQISTNSLKISGRAAHLRDCPPDIDEAVSSLIFASAGCGDFPELYVIRKLFGPSVAVELFPSNLVYKKSLTDDQKYKVVDEIASDNCLQQEVKEHIGNQLVESDGETNHTIAEYTSTENSALVYSVQQYPPCGEEMEKEDFPDLQNKGETMALGPSSEGVSLLPYAEAMVEYYVEEIEESENFESKDGQEESASERSSIRVGLRKSKGAPKKRLKRRSSLLERQGTTENGCIIYYQQPCKSPSTQNYADLPCYCCFSYDKKCYSRALTMTTEQPKNYKDELLRTYSRSSPHPKHVHPKLPQCEDIVAIFTALKRERGRG
ncbi:hypothetical protein HKD37_02G003512 [Glycine soja]|nr:hypothetical protein GmHk_02G003611 [Glycine max]